MIEFNRSAVLQDLYTRCLDVVSENVYVNRPKALQQRVTDFCLVRLPRGLRRYSSICATGWGTISCFAADKANGFENTTKLQEMVDKITKGYTDDDDVYHKPLIPYQCSLYTAANPRLFDSGTDQLGFHSITIQFRIVVKDMENAPEEEDVTPSGSGIIIDEDNGAIIVDGTTITVDEENGALIG